MITPVRRKWWTKPSTIGVLGLMALVIIGGEWQGIPDAIGVAIGSIIIVWAAKAAYSAVPI